MFYFLIFLLNACYSENNFAIKYKIKLLSYIQFYNLVKYHNVEQIHLSHTFQHVLNMSIENVSTINVEC